VSARSELTGRPFGVNFIIDEEDPAHPQAAGPRAPPEGACEANSSAGAACLVSAAADSLRAESALPRSQGTAEAR
jgi:hypothetical protein